MSTELHAVGAAEAVAPTGAPAATASVVETGAVAALQPRGSTHRTFSARAAWPVVVGVALVMSWWSLYALAVGYGVPTPLALAISAVFDGAALVLGDLARRYAMTTDSGLTPRLAMVALVALSGWLNWQHALVSCAGSSLKKSSE